MGGSVGKKEEIYDIGKSWRREEWGSCWNLENLKRFINFFISRIVRRV
jgi:hypothetical protein